MPDLELDRATLEQLARLIRDAADLLDSVDGAAYPGDIGLAAASVDESLVDAAFRQVRRSEAISRSSTSTSSTRSCPTGSSSLPAHRRPLRTNGPYYDPSTSSAELPARQGRVRRGCDDARRRALRLHDRRRIDDGPADRTR
ncbi:hypothetical protein ASE68_17030 [Agromyces sp. Leaf222]|nr:hypothetical protein ASE68_17030 [Agromyces sp. Leaf222]